MPADQMPCSMSPVSRTTAPRLPATRSATSSNSTSGRRSISATSSATELRKTRAVLRKRRRISWVSSSVPSTSFCLRLSWTGASTGAQEARPHADPLGSHRQRGDQTAGVAEAAAGDDRDLQLVDGAWQKHQRRDVVLTGVAGGLEAVDRDCGAAQLLGLQGVLDRGALVNHLDAGGREVRHERLRTAPGRLHRLDARLDDHPGVLFVWRRDEHRQDGQIDAEEPVGHRARPLDLGGERLGCRLRQRGQEAQRAGVGHRGDELRRRDALHPSLDDRVVDIQQFGQSLCAARSIRSSNVDGAGYRSSSDAAITRWISFTPS